jgi:hypothetical protein
VRDNQIGEALRVHARATPMSAALNFAHDGLVLGAETVLLRADVPRRLQSVAGREARLLALLSAACGEVVPRSVAGNIERAAKSWSEGDDCLAYIHLAHARLPAPRDAYSSAVRLLVAEKALTSGIAPKIILQPLKARNSDVDSVEKFDPDEPRVPAGSGKPSGEWTNGGVAGADASAGEQEPEEQPQGSFVIGRAPPPAASFLAELDSAQVAELGLYASRVLGLGGAAAAALGLIFIPSPNDVQTEGQISGVPGLRYSWNRDEALLHFTYDTGDGQQSTFAAYVDGDKFRNEQGRIIGRVLPDGGILIESAVASPLVKDGEPRLCSIPGPDKPNELGRAYENYMKLFVNPPPNTTPSGIGFQLPNPQESDKLVNYDDCRLTTGMLADAKGPGYAGLLAYDITMTSVIQEWWDESERQIVASDGRPVRWYFAELAAALEARRLFDSDTTDGRQRIDVVFLPWSRGQ